MKQWLGILVGTTALVLVGCGGDSREEGSADGSSNQEEASSVGAISTDQEAMQMEFTAWEIVNQSLEELPPGTEATRSEWPNGSPMAEGFLNDGEPIGTWRYWHDSGTLAMRGDYLYGARKDGEWVTWSRSGTRTSIGDYANGVEVGEWRYWYDNGQPSMLGPYHIGEAHGEWQSWHPSGGMASKGEYLQGDRAGAWLFWDSRGRPISAVDYQIPTPFDDIIRD